RNGTKETSKKQKTVASSSQPPQELDMNRFRGQEQFERYKVLEGRKIWNERNFDLFEHGDYEKFVDIIKTRRWDKIAHPPSNFNPAIVREFYANAIPVNNEPFSYTTMVRGRTIRFDRDAINTYLGNPFTLPTNETLCAFQKQRNRGTWDAESMRRKLLRPNTDFVFNATNTPLRAMREDMKTFTQLLFILVLYNIQPNTHTSDAFMNIMGLIHYMNEGLEIDVAGIISRWMKEIVLSGHTDKKLKPIKVKAQSPLGFPCLIMGLCSANRLSIPQIGNEEIGLINDDYVDRYCKPKKKKKAAPPPQPPTQPVASAFSDQNFYNFFTHMYDQNDAGPTFLGGGMTPNADAGEAEDAGDDGDEEENDGGSDASMAEEEEDDAGSDSE
ncbi:hypothetical protein L195_g019512, partial [Trifolium pratense]